LQFEASWSLGSFINGDLPFDVDLLPLPNEKIIVVPDFIYIGSTTQHPAEAYELAKWMTYGYDGIFAKMDIIKNTEGASFSGVPLTAGKIPELDEFFLENYSDELPNFIKMYYSLSEKPENAYMEPFKTLPGFQMSFFDADTGVIGKVGDEEKSLTMGQLVAAIIRGEKQLADYASEMDRIANAEYQKALEALK